MIHFCTEQQTLQAWEQNWLNSLKDDNTIRKSMLKLVRVAQKLKNDKNRDDSLLFSWARFTFLG